MEQKTRKTTYLKPPIHFISTLNKNDVTKRMGNILSATERKTQEKKNDDTKKKRIKIIE